MKLVQTEFFRQWISVVVGTVLVVATVAFVSIPTVLTSHPGEATMACAAPRHLT